MMSALTGSSPEVGSSYSRYLGAPAIARAMPTRFRIPPDSCGRELLASTSGARFTSLRHSGTRASAYAMSRYLALVGEPEPDVLEHVHRVEQRAVLEDVADRGAERGELPSA